MEPTPIWVNMAAPEQKNNDMGLFSELRRRNVMKVALLYALASLLIVWFVGGPLTALGAPPWANEFVLLVLIIGYPVALIFAWTYEITPAGLKKTLDVDQTQSIVYKTGQKLNAAMAVLGVLGLMALVGERLMPTFEFERIVELEPLVQEPLYESPNSPDVPQEIRSYTLDNGLRVIVWPNTNADAVSLYTLIRAGSRNEHIGITGVSHFLSHLQRSPAADAEQSMVHDAFMTQDLTFHHTIFSPDALDAALERVGASLSSIEVSRERFDTARRAVAAERKERVDQNPNGRLFERVLGTAYLSHPYRLPVLGWPGDIAGRNVADTEAWFRRHYVPGNVTLVFAGNVDAIEVFEKANERLGGLDEGAPVPAVSVAEPVQNGVRRISTEAAATTPLLHAAFHIGRASDPDTLALTVLRRILAAADTGRLQREFAAAGGAAINSFLLGGLDPGLMYFYISLPDGADLAAAETLFLETLAEVAANGVTESELSGVRGLMMQEYLLALAYDDGRALALGNAEVFYGDYELAFSVEDALAALTVNDIQAAALKYLRSANMTIGTSASSTPAEQ